MKFKLSKNVNSFRYKGKRYHPGDIVDIAEEDLDRIIRNDLFIPVDKKSQNFIAKTIKSAIASRRQHIKEAQEEKEREAKEAEEKAKKAAEPEFEPEPEIPEIEPIKEEPKKSSAKKKTDIAADGGAGEAVEFG